MKLIKKAILTRIQAYQQSFLSFTKSSALISLEVRKSYPKKCRNCQLIKKRLFCHENLRKQSRYEALNIVTKCLLEVLSVSHFAFPILRKLAPLQTDNKQLAPSAD